MKPEPKTRKVLDYDECTKFIEEKYKIQTRDYAGKFGANGGFERWAKANGETPDGNSKEQYARFTADVKAGKFIDPPYQDFWHWICDNKQPSNGSTIRLYSEDAEVMEPWQQEILALYIKEFGDGAEYETSW